MRTMIPLFLTCLLANRDVCAQLIIVPDKAIQTQIERAEKAFADAFSRAPHREKSVVRFYTELGKLQVLANNNRKHFIQQLFYYSAKKNVDDEAWSLYIEYILPTHVLGISKRTIAEAVAPLLDVEDERIALSVRSWLKAIDMLQNSKGERLYDFSPYRPLISPDNPQESLVRYLYSRSPSSALLLMAEIHGHGEKSTLRDLLWADHVVRTAIWEIRNGFADRSDSTDRAVRQLEVLSRRREWWVRLYVAAIVARYRVFRTDGLMQRLQEDPYSLVQEFMRNPVRAR